MMDRKRRAKMRAYLDGDAEPTYRRWPKASRPRSEVVVCGTQHCRSEVVRVLSKSPLHRDPICAECKTDPARRDRLSARPLGSLLSTGG